MEICGDMACGDMGVPKASPEIAYSISPKQAFHRTSQRQSLK
jgi:hypothetical protein